MSPGYDEVPNTIMKQFTLKRHSTINLYYKQIIRDSDCTRDYALANNSSPKQLTTIALCDLSEAFDVINHSILFKKKEHCGIRGYIKSWLVNYVTVRQLEEVNQMFPKLSVAKSPHGSLLYLLYVNDIAYCTESHILPFSDDTTLFLSDSEPKILFEKPNIVTNKLLN